MGRCLWCRCAESPGIPPSQPSLWLHTRRAIQQDVIEHACTKPGCAVAPTAARCRAWSPADDRGLRTEKCGTTICGVSCDEDEDEDRSWHIPVNLAANSGSTVAIAAAASSQSAVFCAYFCLAAWACRLPMVLSFCSNSNGERMIMYFTWQTHNNMPVCRR